jgi:CRISPR/Cas system CMR-associated protein Cmr3 (group 5 of RAMP superfamily)
MQSGKVREGGPSLDGLKVGGRYKFSCVEEIEEVESTGREQRTLFLIEHEPV